MMLDFDLAWPGGGPGDGVSGSRCRPWNGPLRCHRGPPCACELILAAEVAIVVSSRVVAGGVVLRASGGCFTRPSKGGDESKVERASRARCLIYRERACRKQIGVQRGCLSGSGLVWWTFGLLTLPYPNRQSQNNRAEPRLRCARKLILSSVNIRG